MPSRTDLIAATASLCTAFSTGAPLDKIIATFTTNPQPFAHEHGLGSLAPFLGRTFKGQNGLTEYFNTLNGCLGIEEMSFDDEREWIVDTQNLTVGLRGKAKFVAKHTGEKWDERFCYRISLAEEAEGGGIKVQGYEVWADTGAAYLALRGELKKASGEVRREAEYKTLY
ncbi:hypothetical protein BJX61DRAFT_543922 [Aspergillus egyptiacus]|nr:hypothetical protein BJX61DRAFT_543922 [Aspergillus egyptiacus]